MTVVTMAQAGRRTGMAADGSAMAFVCAELGVVSGGGAVSLSAFDGGRGDVDLEATFAVVSSGTL